MMVDLFRTRGLDHGQGGRSHGQVEDDVHPVHIEPTCGDLGRHVGLEEHVGRHDLDRPVPDLAAEVRDGHADGCDGARPPGVRRDVALVSQRPDADGARIGCPGAAACPGRVAAPIAITDRLDALSMDDPRGHASRYPARSFG